MKKNLVWTLMALVCMGGVFTSCEDNGPNTGGSGEENANYVVSAAVTASGSSTTGNWLLQSGTIDEGTVSVTENGYETSTGTAWLFYGNQYLYRLQYNQGSAGVTSSYVMNSNNAIEERPYQYNITRFTTYGIHGNQIITASAVDTDTQDEAGRLAKGLGFNYLNVVSETTETRTIPGENFLGNGEYVTFAGIVSANNKIYTSIVPMGLSRYGVNASGGKWVTNPDLVAKEDGGSSSSSYSEGEIPGTQYPDSAWIAIYNDNTFQDPTIIKTNKIGFASGRMRSQYYQSIWMDDNNNLYVFSPGYGRLTSNQYQTAGTLPAGVMRILDGATGFDPDYYVNIESISGNDQPFFRSWHITGDYFLLQMYTQGINSLATATTRLAIFKGEEGTLRYVNDGIPAADAITSFGGTPYLENDKAYMAVITNDGEEPAIYEIDPVTATAKKGLVVNGATSLSAVGKLVAQ